MIVIYVWIYDVISASLSTASVNTASCMQRRDLANYVLGVQRTVLGVPSNYVILRVPYYCTAHNTVVIVTNSSLIMFCDVKNNNEDRIY